MSKKTKTAPAETPAATVVRESTMPPFDYQRDCSGSRAVTFEGDDNADAHERERLRDALQNLTLVG